MEGEATHRAIRLSELAEVLLYVVHLSAAEALAALTEARDRGIPVHAETCAHYLFLTNVEYDRPGFDAAKYVMTPPLVELTATRRRSCSACFRKRARSPSDRTPTSCCSTLARPGTSARLSITAGSTTAFSRAGRLPGGSRRCSCAGSLSSTASDGSVARAGAIPQTRPFWRVLTTSGSFAGPGIAFAPKRAFKRFPQPVRRGGQTLRAIARSCRARAL